MTTIKGTKEISIRENGTKRVRTINSLPTLTQQQFKDQSDINKIMERYERTGTVTHLRNAAQGVYADLTTLPSYHEAMQTIVKANDAFDEVPASIRNKFDNDPQKLIDFLKDDKNNKEAVELGLKALAPQDPILNELQTLNQNLKPKPQT